MPVQDSLLDADRDNERDRDRDDSTEKSDRATAKQKPSSSQKTKDLSHVPCKFFKVGACTAGSSCPFSHVVPEPGQKEACAWFVKGNCKFGHKCALAHILPGQNMSMDRKNKKAAQAAAAALAATEKGMMGSKDVSRDAARGGAVRKRDGHHSNPLAGHGGVHGTTGAAHGGSSRNTTLLTGGSTAPTRILGPSSSSSPSTRPPINMPLKAPISPSVPAPPLKDTDFTSFAALDEMEGVDLPVSQQQGRMENETKGGQEHVEDAAAAGDGKTSNVDASQSQRQSKPPSPVPLPTSAPRPSAPPATTDFGPIGSPPSAARLNGILAPRKGTGTISPGTSPRSNTGAAFLHQSMNHDISLSPSGRNAGAQTFLPSSPFSAPGSQSVFLSSSLNTYGDSGANPSFIGGASGRDSNGLGTFNMGGMAASLGTGMALLGGNGDGFDDSGMGISKASRMGRPLRATEHAVVDEDLEEFIPSSLSDLLTPEERRRRMSRSSQQKPQLQAPGASRPPAPVDSSTSGGHLGHRHSRSVPAPSLLGDLKSIWADTSGQGNGTPIVSDAAGLQASNPVPNGTSNLLTDDMGLSMSIGSSSSIGTHINTGLSPSNASAAFLPSLHHHYLKAKQQAQLGLVGTGTMATPASRGGTGVGTGANLTRGIRTASGPLFTGIGATNHVGNVGIHTHGGATHTYRTTPSPFDLTQPQHQHHTASNNRGLGNLALGTGVDDSLANNYYLSSPSARALQAHAPGQSLPQGLAAGLSRIHALPPLPSLTSPGTSVTSDVSGAGVSYGEWKGPASPAPNMIGGMYNPSSTSGMMVNNSHDSRMTYSAATRVGNLGSDPSPPGLMRGVSNSGHRYQPVPGGAPSRPSDDDELFAMDG